MKQRIQGEVRGESYVILNLDGGVMKDIPLSEARGDRKLAAAIKRNGWQELTDGG